LDYGFGIAEGEAGAGGDERGIETSGREETDLGRLFLEEANDDYAHGRSARHGSEREGCLRHCRWDRLVVQEGFRGFSGFRREGRIEQFRLIKISIFVFINFFFYEGMGLGKRIPQIHFARATFL
jgi:hypothetical protein